MVRGKPIGLVEWIVDLRLRVLRRAARNSMRALDALSQFFPRDGERPREVRDCLLGAHRGSAPEKAEKENPKILHWMKGTATHPNPGFYFIYEVYIQAWIVGTCRAPKGGLMPQTRREFCKLAALLPLSMAFAPAGFRPTIIAGIPFGLETFSFHDLPPAGDPRLIPTIIRNMQEIGIAECEIMSGHIEPWGSYATGWWVQTRSAPGYAKMREEARQWRLTVPMTYYRDIRRRFEDAGLRIYYYNVNFNETFTDAERDRTFEAARELGAEGFSSSTVISEAARLVPFVERHRMFVAMHNHKNLVDPDQFATPQSFEKALAMSPYFKATLDTGHFTAGNNDAVAFIREHHDRITNIHIRDRKRNNGPNRPFGQGDTPIKEVLRLIRDNHYPIRGYIEYEYGSFRPSVEEVKACLEYCREALA